jgi:hypothetical protein
MSYRQEILDVLHMSILFNGNYLEVEAAAFFSVYDFNLVTKAYKIDSED